MILRKATAQDQTAIWAILQYAIEKRRLEGSRQWQDGYPNEESVRMDIEKGYGYVLEENATILLYAAILFDGEPAYEAIEGKWLTDGPYAVLHRIAASPMAKGKGVAYHLFHRVEALCLAQGIDSIKVDTNFDNAAMLKILSNLGYTYCGEVFFRGSARKAFEKVVKPVPESLDPLQ
jgi:GNAT superfamily N-acetyltransferase